MLDAHQLNIFLVASETLNFTQAAQQLHMSQPGVSQHIQSLERHLDIHLFERSGRQLRLTDAGAALIPLARSMVQQSIHIEEEMASLKGEIFGHLQVGCSTTPGKYVLPHLLARFHKEYPRVRVTFQVAPQIDAIERLCEGQGHFALSSYKHKDVGADAEFRLFMEDQVVLIASIDHPWAQRKKITLNDLRDADFILREEESGTYTAVRDAFSAIGYSLRDLNVLLTLGNSEAIALAVQEGLGVGFVSHTVVAGLQRKGITIITLQGLNICREIYIGRQKRLPSTAAQTAFWNLIDNLNPPIKPESFL